VAEGVETEAPLDYLQAMRCDEHQGYLSSRPIAPTEFKRLLHARPLVKPLKLPAMA
jgi:diguanylate cyclase